MHVAIYGAGALGSVYGVRLAASGVTVTFIVRAARVPSREPMVIERVKDVRDRRHELGSPRRSAEIPGDADVIMLAVGTEDLDAIRPVLDTSSAPILVLTPMLSADWARMRSAFGDRVLAAMPSVVAYARKEDGVVRYWLPPAPTRFDEPRAGEHGVVVRALAERLDQAGIPTHLELGVHETNPATTVCMIPIGMAVGLAGGMQALAKDEELLELTSRACSEGVALGRSIGRPEAGALLAPLLARPTVLRMIVAGVSRWFPEALFYVDEHFGRKLLAQHEIMAREMAELARERHVPHAAIDDLAIRLARA